MLVVVRIKSMCASLDAIGGYFFHCWIDIFEKIVTALVFFVYVVLEILVGYFIAFLVTAIIG